MKKFIKKYWSKKTVLQKNKHKFVLLIILLISYIFHITLVIPALTDLWQGILICIVLTVSVLFFIVKLLFSFN